MAKETIRPATRTDEEPVRILIYSILAEYGLEPSPATTDGDLYDLAGFYRDGAFDVMVDEAGEIIGTLGLKALSPTVCELRKMYLRAGARGKGLGARLLRHAIERAKELGFRRIELETASVLEEAIGLYRKFGFEATPNDAVEARCDMAMALDL
ncbi:MAG: GNAT family N-acetyltransferase [Parvularculaceae bacterium]